MAFSVASLALGSMLSLATASSTASRARANVLDAWKSAIA
jgi:hypothetical protein